MPHRPPITLHLVRTNLAPHNRITRRRVVRVPPSSGLCECVSRELSEPVLQGDVFRWIRPDPADAWSIFGVIVTADCDLAHNKHRGSLSYCPVLRIEDFLRLFWLPDELIRQKGIVLKKAGELIGALQRLYSPGYDKEIDSQLVLPWLGRRGRAGVADDLGVPDGAERRDLLAQLGVLEKVEEGVQSVLLDRQLDAITVARIGKVEPTAAQHQAERDRTWKDVGSRVRKLPGDLFFINALTEDTRGGFIVFLRSIREIMGEAIAIDPRRERDGVARAVRISRLASPYRYRLVQQLGAVFADIGLPEHYESACAETIRGLASTI